MADSKSDFEEFVSQLSEDDEDDRAILEVLKIASEAYAKPSVRAAIEAAEQRRRDDDAMLSRARSEGRAARRNGDAKQLPDALAEEYAKRVMAVWEEENPPNYPEAPWDDFARDREVSDLEDFVRDRKDRVAARYFRASGLYHGMMRSFLEGYNAQD